MTKFRDEFEAAWFSGLCTAPMRQEFLRGAKWMAERCAEICEKSTSNSNDTYRIGGVLRQLIKDLEP